MLLCRKLVPSHLSTFQPGRASMYRRKTLRLSQSSGRWRTGCTFHNLLRLTGNDQGHSWCTRLVLVDPWQCRRRTGCTRCCRFRWRDCPLHNPSKLRFQCWLQSSQLHSPRRSSARSTQSLPSISQFRSQRKRPGRSDRLARCTFQLGRRYIPRLRPCRSISPRHRLCKRSLQRQNMSRRHSPSKRSLLLQNRSRRHSPSKRSLLLQNISQRHSPSKRSLRLQNRSRRRSPSKRSLLLQNISRRRSSSKWIPPWQRDCRSTSLSHRPYRLPLLLQNTFRRHS